MVFPIFASNLQPKAKRSSNREALHSTSALLIRLPSDLLTFLLSAFRPLLFVPGVVVGDRGNQRNAGAHPVFVIFFGIYR